MRRRWLVWAAIAAVFVCVGVGLWWSSAGVQRDARALYTEGVRLIASGQLDAGRAKLESLASAFPQSRWADDALWELGQALQREGDASGALAAYKRLVTDYAGSSYAKRATEALGTTQPGSLFGGALTSADVVYEVRPGDNLTAIAKRFGTTVELIMRANGLTGDLIRPGQRLTIVSGHFNVLVDKSDNTLELRDGDRVLKTYAVATGSGENTPVGAFKIANKLVDPPWYKPGAGRPIPPGDPENILGTRWMGFDVKGYGIHGTTEPDSIGQSVTAGCIRMRNNDVEELYAILPVGADVTIVE